jgi:hypothetical protein
MPAKQLEMPAKELKMPAKELKMPAKNCPFLTECRLMPRLS